MANDSDRASTLARFTREGQLEDAVFRAAAKVPGEWMGVGIVRQGPPFDLNEFLRLCGEETDGLAVLEQELIAVEESRLHQ